MIYLDNAATSAPKAPGVSESVAAAVNLANANRASHREAVAASELLYDTRVLLAQLLGADDSRRIIFTSGTTLAVNLVIHGLLRPGDRVLVSPLEHNAVMRPLQCRAQRDGISIDRFTMRRDGTIDRDDWQRRLAARPALVICTAVSNVTGTVLPWQELARDAHAAGARFCLDAAQALGTLPLSVADAPVDFLCASGHKGLHGPAGTGLLYVAPDADLDAVLCGGTGSHSSEEFQPEEYPDKLECGTPNLPGIAGLQAAVRWLQQHGVATVTRHLEQLTALARRELQAIPGITLHGGEQTHGIVSFTHARLSVSDITRELDRRDIAVRGGLHCAPAAHRCCGTFPDGTVRCSFGALTTADEVSAAIDALRSICHG